MWRTLLCREQCPIYDDRAPEESLYQDQYGLIPDIATEYVHQDIMVYDVEVLRQTDIRPPGVALRCIVT